MKSVRGSGSSWGFLVLFSIVALWTGRARGAGVDVALVPSTAAVPAGTEFEIRLDIVDLGPEFNTYEAYVGYDPSMLTFLPTSPLALQEGPYMTGACGVTFHLFQAGTRTLHITHSLLCADQFLTGPGCVYVLRFRPVAPGTTGVHIEQIDFYRGGPSVSLGTTTDAIIQISPPTDAGGPSASRLQVQVAPNPFNPTTRVTIETPTAGFQRLVVHDLRGRRVDVLDAGEFPAGKRRIVWSARTADGARLASGAYFLRLETPRGNHTERVILVK